MTLETLSPGRMHSRISHVDGVVALQLAGEIDISEISELETAFGRARARANGALALDLESVSFLDLAGMVTIIRSMRQAAQEGCAVTVVSAGARVRRVFALTGNEALLDASPSLVDVPIAASIEPAEEGGAPDG